MMDAATLDLKTDALLVLMREKFGVRSKSLSKAMAKIGRRFPARLHRQAEVILAARQVAGHPKLMLLTDAKKVETACDEITAFLAQIDVADRRKGVVLNLLGSLSLNLISVAVMLLAFLIWQGFL